MLREENQLCRNVAALMAAIQWASYKRVKELLDGIDDSNKCKVIVNSTCGPMLVLPLQLAANICDENVAVEIVKLLLEHGARANCCDKLGRTPLHHAATLGHTKVIEILLSACASINSRYAITHRPDNRFSFNDQECMDGTNCSREATAANNLPFPECWGRTPLHQAVKSGNVSSVQVLLKNGANVNALDEKGLSPLLLAGAGILPDDVFAVTRYEKIVELLIKKGANVKVMNDDIKCSPLHYSVSLGSVAATHLLLERGAKLHSIELVGDTVLHVAASAGSVQVLNLLLQYNAKDIINACDLVGCTPLHKAAYSGNRDCLNILINNGGDLAAQTHSGLTVIDIIFSYLPRPEEFFRKILDSKIMPNRASINDRDFKIKLDFDVLAPKTVTRQTAVIALLSEESKIVQHPLVEAFIHCKWRRMRQIFLLLFVIHICFVLSFSTYMVMLVHPECDSRYGKNDLPKDHPSKSSTENTNFEKSSCYLIKDYWGLLKTMMFIFVIITGSILLLHHSIELWLLGPVRLRQFEPWLNFVCTFYSIALAVFSFHIERQESTVDHTHALEYVSHVASIVVLIGWGRVMFLLARFPTWGYYGLMSLAVLKNVVKVMMTFICLVIGFVLCYCIQFPKNPQFSNPWRSFVRTTVMMAGEFEYINLFEQGEQKILATSRFVFLLFVLLASIVLMNLMVGLAVSDVQDLQTEGHVKRLKKQAEFMSHLEKLTLNKILQSSYVGRLLLKRHMMSTKIIIDASVNSCINEENLPYYLLESIISVALRNKRLKDTMKHQKQRTPGHSNIDISIQSPSKLSLPLRDVLTSDGAGSSRLQRPSITPTDAEKDLYSSIKDLKNMVQVIIENQQGDTDRGYLESDTKAHAVIRQMSQYKKRRSVSGYYGRNKHPQSLPV